MDDVEFFDLEGRLVAAGETYAAAWNPDGWKIAGAELARKAQADGVPLTREQAAREFPEADLVEIPQAK